MNLGVNDGDAQGAFPWDIWNRAAVLCQLEDGLAVENAAEIAQVEGGERYIFAPVENVNLIST